jgi:DNA-binding IclR family transcriptional regulator
MRAGGAFAILSELETGEKTAKELAQETGIASSTVMGLIETMVDEKWVERTAKGYCLGTKLAVCWAKRTAYLKTIQAKAGRELGELT